MSHSFRDAHLLSGAYVLHALDPEERAVVEAAMHESEELRGEIAELSDTAVELGLAVARVQPPAALRARVLALAAGAPQLAPEPVAAVPERPAGRAERTAQQRWYRRPGLLAAAAAAVLLVGGVGGLGIDRVLNPDGGSSTQQLTQIITASDAKPYHSDVAGGGTATVYTSDRLAESAVVLDGVPQPTGGRVLQVWRLSNGSATSLGVYSATGPGYVLEHQALHAGEQIAVTVEPAGGSTKPTTTPLVALTA